MAEVIGFLREDAICGENRIFSLRQVGYRDGQIAVLVRQSQSIKPIRERLYMTYFAELPRPYEDLRRGNVADFVE
jgi:hypothetical protein